MFYSFNLGSYPFMAMAICSFDLAADLVQLILYLLSIDDGSFMLRLDHVARQLT
jgi:hypothetical protein